MNKFHTFIQKHINNNDKDKIVSLLHNLYSILNKDTKKNKNYWLSKYIFDDFVNYIIENGILTKLNCNAKHFFESYITIKYFTKPPPKYQDLN